MAFDFARLEPARDLIAYFCAEFGIDARLPLYSGGLGVLAGDHLKTAADVGLPLVAVGLLYREGYFRQRLDAHGRQHAEPDPLDPEARGLESMRDARWNELRVAAPLYDHALQLRVWRTWVGKVPLFLLDADCPENAPEDRRITARLYGGDRDMRLRQEIVLGIGGVRALRGLGLRPSVWHLNEGHAAFAGLERIRERVADGLGFSAALEIVAASTVFTTHTPVPAGHDVFGHAQLRHWLGDYLGSLHATERRLLALGANGEGHHRFSMTALAMRLSRFRNAVSRIHRDVAVRMESYLWPRVPPEENPVHHVTNAVHLPTFLSPEWRGELDARLPDWHRRPLAAADLDWVAQLSDDEFARRREPARLRLIAELRRRLSAQHERNGLPAELLVRALEHLRPETLLMGFARRFATYKRAALMLSDPQRLVRLLGNSGRPAVLVYAGKAHPHDGPGQEVIRVLYEHALRPEFLGRLIVLEGYDLDLARALVQGCDVWLNTPEYPLEASGTSGMKAGVNGALNVSILDGWWAEGFDGCNGFGIAPRTDLADPAERNRAEAEALFQVLEQRVLPAWYDDRAAWLKLARNAVQTLIPRYGSARMLADYARELYGSAARHGERMQARHARAAVEFARWKKLVHAQAAELRVEVLGRDPLRVKVHAQKLPCADLAVEAHVPGRVLPLQPRESGADGALYALDGAAPPGARLRVLPVHPLLPHRLELGVLAEMELGA